MRLRSRLAQLLAEAPAEAEAIEHDGVWWTWGRIQQIARAVLDALDAAGQHADARIGVVLENRPEHIAALAAVIASGRCVVTLNPLQPAARLAADIARSDLPVVIAGDVAFASDGVLDAVKACGLALHLSADGSLRAAGGAAPAAAAAHPDVAVEMFTSGTTGPPKRVCLRVDQLEQGLVSGGQTSKHGRLLTRSVALVAAPLVHIGGLFGALACLTTGRRMVLLPKFELRVWVSAVERHRLRASGLVPAALRTVLDADVPPERLASLEVVTSGTAPCPPELADAFFRKYGIRVLMIYGATEFAGAVAGWTLPLHEMWWDAKAGSAGRAFPGVELRVTGADGVELPIGQSGRLEVRSAQTSRGVGAWVHTSDLACIDSDHFLWIEGRADDAIIRGGFKVQPETIKRALEAHPAVREAAVAGLADARLGAVPVAAVEVEPLQTRPDPAELVAHCRDHLTPYEVPVHILLLDELPRTPSSKVNHVELLDIVRARLAEKNTIERVPATEQEFRG